MRQQFVMGNWKMNGSLADVVQLLNELKLGFPDKKNVGVAVFPPAIYLPKVAEILKNSPIAWGAQTVSSEVSGAYTGEISAAMLKDYGCQYVLVGHSERRILFKEDEKCVAKKFHLVKEHGMIPVLCIGETEKERQSGLTLSVLHKQISAVTEMQNINVQEVFKQCIIAYEPVWAIGTGNTAKPADVAEVHGKIREIVAKLSPGSEATLPILYGGSVTEKTAGALFEKPDIDGGLVGGASLKAEQFLEIIKCIKSS